MKTLHSILIFILMISTTFNSSAQNNDSKILVAYYSYSGNTKAVAEQIQKGTDGDLFEIQPIKPYSKNYQEVVDQESIHYLPFVKYIIVSSRKSFKINSPKFRQALKLFN